MQLALVALIACSVLPLSGQTKLDKAPAPSVAAKPNNKVAPSNTAAMPAKTPANERIDINSATVEQLEALGLHPHEAKKVISRRPYLVLEELVAKRALSLKTFSKIKDKVRVK
jgi:DNA uptake protein ComE-like DNA-binding protein